MECPSCSFQNTPGTRTCVRCQSLLDFSGVSVIPPRASGGAAVRLARGSVAVLGFRFRDAARGAGRRSPIRLDEGVRWGAALCSIVPGLGQVIVGRWRLGLFIFLLWLLLLAAYFTNYGTTFSFFCGTLAMAVHCGAVCALLSPSLQKESVGFRAAFGFIVYIILVLFIYGPLYWGTNGFIGSVPAYGLRPVPGVQEGDLLIHTGPWLHPTLHRGDLVAYRIQAHRADHVQLYDGVLFDRILGLPGDEIEINGREVKVNGELQPPELAPLGGSIDRVTLTAGPDEYIIFPSLLRPRGNVDARLGLAEVAQLAAHVNRGDVLGRIFWRVGPGLDFGPVKGSLK
jgi:hypothetical protein